MLNWSFKRQVEGMCHPVLKAAPASPAYCSLASAKRWWLWAADVKKNGRLLGAWGEGGGLISIHIYSHANRSNSTHAETHPKTKKKGLLGDCQNKGVHVKVSKGHQGSFFRVASKDRS